MAAPAPVQSFSPRPQTAVQEKGFRLFRVEDEFGVDLPNCERIDRVMLDGVEIPEFITETVMKDNSRKNYRDVKLALWKLEMTANGPTLIRSFKSNHGRWQKGSVVAVKGEWADGGDGLDDLGFRELHQIAEELQVAVLPTDQRVDIVQQIRKQRYAVSLAANLAAREEVASGAIAEKKKKILPES